MSTVLSIGLGWLHQAVFNPQLCILALAYNKVSQFIIESEIENNPKMVTYKKEIHGTQRKLEKKNCNVFN